MSNNNTWKQARTKARMEDLTWLAQTGEGLTGAASRLGIRHDALVRWCEKNAPTLLRQLRDNETSGTVRKGKVLL